MNTLKTTIANFSKLLFVSVICVMSCAEDGIIEESPRVTIPASQELVRADLYGQVIDEQDSPIAGARVTYQSGRNPAQLVTDEDGYFIIQDVENKGAAAYVTVTYPGKFEAFRKFSLVPQRINYTEIKMMDRDVIGSVASSTGGTLSHEDGAEVSLPANGFITSTGQTYEGDVEVVLAWIDPSAEDLSQRMVGDLSGIDEDGNLRSLSSMGMLQVELIGDNGEDLNLDNGATAALTFPIPASLRTEATDVIPLWSYDELEGIWVQEGLAIREGNVYIGEVTHFSSWNVDFMTDPIEITGQVKVEVQSENGSTESAAGSFLQVFVCSDLIGRKGGWLCEDGSFRFYNFPSRESFKLKVLNQCGNVIFEGSYGAFTSNQDLGTITVSNPPDGFVKISGNAINCDEEPVVNGFVLVTQGEDARRYPINEDGTFDIGHTYCQGFDIGVEIVDLDSLQQSEELIIAPGQPTAEFIDVFTCEELQNFIIIEPAGHDTILLVNDISFISGERNDSASNLFFITHEPVGSASGEVLLIEISFPDGFDTDPSFVPEDIPVTLVFLTLDEIRCSSRGNEINMTANFMEFNTNEGAVVEGVIDGTLACLGFNDGEPTSAEITIQFKLKVTQVN